jgi:hypothetical protein
MLRVYDEQNERESKAQRRAHPGMRDQFKICWSLRLHPKMPPQRSQRVVLAGSLKLGVEVLGGSVPMRWFHMNHLWVPSTLGHGETMALAVSLPIVRRRFLSSWIIVMSASSPVKNRHQMRQARKELMALPPEQREELVTQRRHQSLQLDRLLPLFDDQALQFGVRKAVKIVGRRHARKEFDSRGLDGTNEAKAWPITGDCLAQGRHRPHQPIVVSRRVSGWRLISR